MMLFFPILICFLLCVCETKFLPLDLIQKAYPIHQYYVTKRIGLQIIQIILYIIGIYISDLYITSSIWLLT